MDPEGSGRMRIGYFAVAWRPFLLLEVAWRSPVWSQISGEPPELEDGAVCGPDGSGRIRMDPEGSGRMRMDPDGSGWVRIDPDAAALPRLPHPLTPIRICGVYRYSVQYYPAKGKHIENNTSKTITPLTPLNPLKPFQKDLTLLLTMVFGHNSVPWGRISTKIGGNASN